MPVNLEWNIPDYILTTDKIIRDLSDDDIGDFLRNVILDWTEEFDKLYLRMGGTMGGIALGQSNVTRHGADRLRIMSLMSLGRIEIGMNDISTFWDREDLDNKRVMAEAHRRNTPEMRRLCALAGRITDMVRLIISALQITILDAIPDARNMPKLVRDKEISSQRMKLAEPKSDEEITELLESSVLPIYIDAYENGVPVDDILA